MLPATAVAQVSIDHLNIQCGDGVLALLEVQPESKPKLKINEFSKSVSLKKGDLFQ